MASRKETTSPALAERVPLVVVNDERPSLASPEMDDTDDDRESVTKPYPGVDDGFFGKDAPKSDGPVTSSRPGPDGGSEKPEDNEDGKDTDASTNNLPGRLFPYPPSFRTDIETGSQFPDLESIPDVNVYQHKKTLAQGMMDLALFSANANQLRYVLESFSNHPYYYPSVVFISFSLVLQVAIGVGLVWNATYNVKDEKEICVANKINNFTVIGIFLVTVINVFISAFGVANAPAAVVPVTGT